MIMLTLNPEKVASLNTTVVSPLINVTSMKNLSSDGQYYAISIFIYCFKNIF